MRFALLYMLLASPFYLLLCCAKEVPTAPVKPRACWDSVFNEPKPCRPPSAGAPRIPCPLRPCKVV